MSMYPVKYNTPPIDENRATKDAATSMIATGANMVVPGAGVAIQGLSTVSNAIAGDGSNIKRQLIADQVDPLSQVKSIIDGNFKEAIPILGAKFKADRLRSEMAEREKKEAAYQSNSLKKDSAGFYSKFRL